MYDLLLIIIICFGVATGLGIAVVIIVCMVGNLRQETEIENLDVEAQTVSEVVSPVPVGDITRTPVEPIVAVDSISRFQIEPIIPVQDVPRPFSVPTGNSRFQLETVEEIPRPIRPSFAPPKPPQSRKTSSLQVAVFEEIQKLHPITRQNAIENGTQDDIEEISRPPSVARQYSVLNDAEVNIENCVEPRDDYDEEDTVIIMSMVHKYRVRSMNELNNKVPSRKFPVTQSGLLKKSYDYREDIYDR